MNTRRIPAFALRVLADDIDRGRIKYDELNQDWKTRLSSIGYQPKPATVPTPTKKVTTADPTLEEKWDYIKGIPGTLSPFGTAAQEPAPAAAPQPSFIDKVGQTVQDNPLLRALSIASTSNILSQAEQGLLKKAGVPESPLLVQPRNTFEKALQVGSGLATDAAIGGAALKAAAPIVKPVLGAAGKATQPVKTAAQKSLELAQKAPTGVKIGGGVLGTAAAVDTGVGAFTPNEQAGDRSFFEKTGASLRVGVGDVLTTTGSVAKWQGADKLGESLTAKGEAIREGYEQKPVEFTWKSLLDPNFYSTNVARSLPLTASLVPAMIAGYKGTGAAVAKTTLKPFQKAILSSLGGAAVSRPIESALEAGSTYEDMLSKGKTPEEANEAANSVFKKNLLLTGMDTAQLIAAFAPIKAAKIGKAGRIAGRIGADTLLEGTEEGIQEVFQRQATGQPIAFDPQMQEAMAIGGLMGAGMGGAGAISDVYKHIQDRTVESLPEVKAQVEQEVANGAPRGEVVEKALDTLAETPEGQQVIESVVQAVNEEVKSGKIKVMPYGQYSDIYGTMTDKRNLQTGPEAVTGQNIVYDKQGRKWEVLDDTSDPSKMRVRSESGAETWLGKKAVLTEPPQATVQQPQAPIEPQAPAEPQITEQPKPQEIAPPTLPVEPRKEEGQGVPSLKTGNVQQGQAGEVEGDNTGEFVNGRASQKVNYPNVVKASDLPELNNSINDYINDTEIEWDNQQDTVFEKKNIKLSDLEKAKTRPLQLSQLDMDMRGKTKSSGPIVLDSDYSIIDGMHRLADAVDSGVDTIEAYVRTEQPTQPTSTLADYNLSLEQSTTKNGNTAWAVKGDSFAHKDILKRLGARWYKPHPKAKGVWTFYGEDPTSKILAKLPPLEKEEAAQGQERLESKPVKPDTDKLKTYAKDVTKTGEIKSVTLVGSTAAKGAGNDIDLLYDLGDIDLPVDSNEAAEQIESIIENMKAPIDIDIYDTFIKAGDRFFHLSSGAGREIVENTEYAKEQAGKSTVVLAKGKENIQPTNTRKPSQKPETKVESKQEEPAAQTKSDKMRSWLQNAEKDARARLKERQGRVLSGLPMDDMLDYTIIGASKLAVKAMDLAEFTKAMLDDIRSDFGEKAANALKNWLPGIYAQSQHMLDMDPEEVEQMIRDAVKEEPAKQQKPQKEETPHLQVANFVLQKLQKGDSISSAELYQETEKAYGGSAAQGKFTPKDAYDAMELGVNQFLLGSEFYPTATEERARQNLKELEKMLANLPTQTKRTAEQDEFQQFSTPPNLAYVAAWAANINKNDTVLEPSAGIGGLAVFAKKAGAEVVVNELSKRRLELLKEMGFDQVFNEDAEQIDNILPESIKPTVVIMNPPFSSTAGRMEGKRDTKFSTVHIEQALNRLEDNGRLVMIVGRGMSDDAASFKSWWKKIKEEYNVLLNVGIDGKNYKKYGTSFDVQLIVIDKTGPTTAPTVTGKLTDLEDVLPFLEVVRNERVSPAKQPTSKSNGKGTTEESRGETGPEPIVPISTTEVGAGERGNKSRGRNKPQRDSGSVKRGGDVSVSSGTTESNGLPPEGGEPISGAEPVRKTEGAAGSSSVSDRQDQSSTDRGRLPGPESGIKVESQESTPVVEDEELSESVYTIYTPQRLKVPGAQQHPGNLAQSAAMAAVEPPEPTYTPNLPGEVIKEGKLSIAQLEAIVYAGQSHNETLPNGQRRGFFIGDGTGVGKGREISGIILDNMRQGRNKAVWVSKNAPLLKDAKRDFGDIGGNPEQIFDFGKIKIGTQVKQDNGILFTTYNTLSQGLEVSRDGNITQKKGKKARLDQIVDWLGKDFDGVIAFDEAHHMQNSLTMKGKRGMTKPSSMALSGVELQRRLPKARVVYVSATGATEVANLAYADRLGLWGEGTPFADKRDFVAKIQSGGLAAMELVARDMKAMGIYIARSLSFDGVTYGTLEHKLTGEQTEIYDTMAKGWQIVLQNISKALETTGQQKNGNAKGQVLSQFWSSQQRFFNQVITSMQMPAVINQVKEDLKNGKAVIMQLVNTNEAIQNRAIARQEEGDSLEDIDLTPRDILMQYLDKSFPVQQYETYMDEDGNERSRPVVDSHGDPVLNRKAVAMKEELMAQLGAMKVPEGPLEIVLNTFGVENVAEITGRTQRVIRVKDTSGRMVAKKESRTPKHAEADANAFMDDKKQILVFSDAGGTGRSYHADARAKNQRPREHYLIQAGWRADSAVQGFGRSHRTNEVSQPHCVLVTTDLKGQKRFISSIARRLDQLGALTKGQRQTGSQGLFSAKDNLESNMARDALQRFYEDLVGNQIPGLRAHELLKKMGLEGMLDEKRSLKENPNVRDITKFLNRLLSLESITQNKVFDAFSGILDRAVEEAIANGTLDIGLENFKADKVNIQDEKTVFTEDKSGAETKYVELEASHRNKPVSFSQASKISRFDGFYLNTRSGRIYARRLLGNKTLASGNVVQVYEMYGQSKDNITSIDRPQFERGNWEKVEGEKAKQLWQEALDKLPEYRTQKVHLITGALLPIWDRLPQDRIVRVIRVRTDDGQVMLGRIIPERAIDNTLRNLGASRTVEENNPADIVDKVLNGGYTAYLSNEWKISKRRVSGENRIEISGNDLYRYVEELLRAGVFRERINYDTRFFIPTGDDAAEVLGKIIKYRPVVDLVAPSAHDDIQGMTRPAPSPKGTNQTAGTIRRKDIIKFLETKFAPIRIGRFRGKSLGIFKIKPEVIRTRLAHDLPVIAHEVGHYLDKRLGLANPAYDNELIKLGHPQARQDYTQEQIRKEGVAEFMRLYLTDPAGAKQEAPNYYAAFENILEVHPDIKDILQTTQRDIELWYNQPAEARVAGAISVGDKGTTRKMSLDRLYSLTIDEIHPLKKFVEQMGVKGLPIEQDPYKLAWLARGWSGKAETLLHRGVLDQNGDKIGKSLDEVLKPVKNELDAFRNYAVAKHSLEVTAQGKHTGIMDADAQEVVNNAPVKYQDVLEDLVEYQDALLDLLIDSGVMDYSSKLKMRQMYQNYVPFYRVFDEDLNTVAAYMSKGGFANLRNPVKAMKGSTREIVDPIESIIKNTFIFANVAERNNVGRSIVELAESKDGTGQFVEKVDAQHNVAKENILTVYRNGKAEKFQLDPDLYRATLALDRESANMVVKILSYPASWLRAGATLSPDFMVRNPLRDQFSAFINSKYGYIPGYDLVKGVFHAIKKDDMFWQFQNSGAAHSTMVALDRDYLQNSIKEFIGNTTTKEKIITVVNPKTYIEMLRALSELGEYGTRLGEFSKGIKKGASPLEAALSARDLTLDFARVGTHMKQMNRIIAFMNAAIQGGDKMVRQFKAHPAKTMLRVALSITLPSVLLWLANHDDDRYKELPQWQKDMFWIVLTKNHIFRIPKPFELGILFGTVPERILAWTYEKDPNAFKELGKTIRDAFLPGWMPTALLPVVETWANKSFFTNRPIVPEREKYLEAKYQSGPYTTETAKAIGDILNWSPRKIENFIRGYTGGLGMYTIKMAEGLGEVAGVMDAKNKPSLKAAQYPVLKSFMVEPYESSQSVQDFYDELNTLEKKSTTAKQTKQVQLTKQEEGRLKQLRKVADKLSDIRKTEREIENSKNMTPDQKKEALERSKMLMVNLTRGSLGKTAVR